MPLTDVLGVRSLLVFCLLLPLAGCLGSAEKASPRIEGFTAIYERDGEPVSILVLDGPHDRLGPDLDMRPAYRLRLEGIPADPLWSRDADYIDGAGQLVRRNGCSIFSDHCERYSVKWKPTFVGGYDLPVHGAFWPFSESPNLTKSWRGDTLVIERVTPGGTMSCWMYEGMKPVPVRSCDGEVKLTSYESFDLAAIAPWPSESANPARGPAKNELFPGADQDLQGFGFSPLDALAALKLNSAQAASKLDAGGCVLTTLLGHGSGGFGIGFPNSLLERPVANISFTVQDDATSRVKYTLTWVEDHVGTKRFSTRVHENSPDRQGGPSCSELKAAPWPAIGADDFLADMVSRFGPICGGIGCFEVSRQPAFLAPTQHVRYKYDGLGWGGAGMYFDADAGLFGHASYIGPNDLEPEQNT